MDKKCKKSYALDKEDTEPVKGWGVDLRAPFRTMQKENNDKWDRTTTGVAIFSDDMETKAFGKADMG